MINKRVKQNAPIDYVVFEILLKFLKTFDELEVNFVFMLQ